ncbi:hypothetical protein [Actinomycetospora soli]|uniref:hypothetical protein n=1 Tax=Actinomycetospora soli TaxID=2893887 RepID=UPI001E487920|nr:hypothetical protein [Actinomycetospora soli]MCD2190962.1 hypothetical protein [Actinomycetospora soli]
MSDEQVVRGRAGDVYRRRVSLEWRAAIAVAAVAVTGTVLGLLPLQDAWLDVGLLGGFGVIVVIALGLLVLAWTRPVPLPPVMPKRFSYRDATTAAGRVRRGEPVDPPELQAAAIDQTRRGLRTSLLTMG